MSGHSKWSQIKRQKEKTDQKKGVTFTKLSNAIAIAVKSSGGVVNIDQNFRLRLAVDDARALNMPKENIERAIKRGLAKEGGGIEEVIYEGFAPGGVAIIVKAATDNRNRTTAEIKSVIEKNGGTFASVGAVSWMFKDQGLITVPKNGKNFDEIFEAAADSGAEDLKETGDVVEVYTKPNDLFRVKNYLSQRGLAVQSAQLYKTPSTYAQIKDAGTADKVVSLIDKLEELDDVQSVYANFDIQDGILKD
ncbi:MAG: YebC/PmpR family DNA-binding transcriptional regulator [Patescibacteria group bacterium]|nr:YebC/PmpR family DNA-binding transcriptional regulator [Patescibacteria group bacterium]